MASSLDGYLADLPDSPTHAVPFDRNMSPISPPPSYTSGDDRHRGLSRQATVSQANHAAPTIPREPSRRSGKTRFVIGLDFGTTYTGLAYATANSNNADLNAIEVLQDWTPTMSNAQKVRSVVSYGTPGQMQWGTDISKDAVTMANTKLDLGPREKRLDELEATLQFVRGAGGLSLEHIRQCGPQPAFTPNSPEQIVTDYLTKIRECACKENNIDLRQLATTKIPVDLVVTVPVNWSFEAKNSTFKALRSAGFDRSTFPTLEDTIMVSEPEAASYFTARDLYENGIDFLEENQCFILCDAGGGTVDVVSLQVTQAGSKLKLQKATEPQSGNCGSVFIDTAFKRWLLRIIGEQRYCQLDPYHHAGSKIYPSAPESGPMRELIKRFEVQKKLFSRSTGTVKIDLPEPLSDLSVEGRVREGELTITRKEMEAMFRDCVNEIIRLIDAQVYQVRDIQGRRVLDVFLVGGFGASPYLQEVLRDSLQLRKPKMELRRPETIKSWTAVVQGAVIYGIEKSRHADFEAVAAITRSYGFSFSRRSDSIWRFDWLIRRGDLVMRHEKRIACSRILFVNHDKNNRDGRYELDIFSFRSNDNEDDGPEWWQDGHNEVSKVLRVTYDISQIARPSKRSSVLRRNHSGPADYWVGPFTCQMEVVGTTLDVKIMSGNMVLGSARTQVEVDRPPG